MPETIQNLADWVEPPTPANAGLGLGDKILYWLAFLHFGPINGIGIPSNGPESATSRPRPLGAIRSRARHDVRDQRESCGGTACFAPA
jgi:hypothetical protein